MIKHYCSFACSSFLFATSLFTMDSPFVRLDLGKVSSTVFVTERTAATGSEKGCFLIFNPATPTERIEQLHNKPTLNLFTDKKNRVGALYKDYFVVYDVTTQKKVWTQIVYQGDRYATHSKDCYAAFSNVDDTIFICQQDELRSNKGLLTTLAHIGNGTSCNIACHPSKQELAYPCSNESFTIKQLNSPAPAKQYYAKIEKEDCIRRIFYSPDGSRIGLHTDRNKLYVYDILTKKTTPITNPAHSCDGTYHNPMFLPGTNNIIVFICEEHFVHYYDLKTNGEITSIQPQLIETPTFTTDNFLTNILDFSPDGTQLATGMSVFDAHASPVGNIKHMIRKYTLLKKYFIDNSLPQEIVKLISELFYHAHPFRIFESPKS